MSSSTPPTALLPSEVTALRLASGIDAADFARALGVSPEVVDRWERFGIPTGPTALALRLVAESMKFDFPVPTLGSSHCGICGEPASERFSEQAICPSCHRDPRTAMKALDYDIFISHNNETMQTSVQLRLPPSRAMRFTGRFLSEGLGTLLTKIYKDEPQFGDQSWDSAVYVQWIDPGLDALADDTTRDIIRALVAYGLVEVNLDSIRVTSTASFVSHDDEILLLSGLLASRQTDTIPV